jgi:polyferredoxin
VNQSTRPGSVTTAFLSLLTITLFCVTSCATTSTHNFSEPSTGWHTKTGQLRYQSPKTTFIGEALVRFSKTGDFELTVSKGPGITLLSLRQDAAFAEVKGPLARQGWSGLTNQAPEQLRPWLELRDQFVRAPDQKTLRYASGNDTFLFRF